MITVQCLPPGLVATSEILKLTSVIERCTQDLARAESVAFGEVTILVVDTPRIRELHRKFFSDPSSTDVITFPADAEPGSERLHGDIAICVDVAREQAVDAGHETHFEIVFLALHGLLHLCGWDDHDDDDRARMVARQYEMMVQAGLLTGRRR